MLSRRRVLAVGGLALVGGAGCVGDSATGTGDPGDGATGTTGTGDATGRTATDKTTTTGETTATGETTRRDDASKLRITVTSSDGEVELVTGDDVATVGEVGRSRTGSAYRIPVTLTDEGTAAFLDGLERVGAFEDRDDHRLRTYFDGELRYEATLGPQLADVMESGEWGGEFLLTVDDRETAEEMKAALADETGTTKKVETETTNEAETTRGAGTTTNEGETARD